MAFLRSVSPAEAGPQLHGQRVSLRVPGPNDYAPWAELRAQSREFLTPWEPAWSCDELSRTAFRRRLRFYQREIRDQSGYPFFIFADNAETLVGGLSLSQVRRGVTQSCSVGYWLGQPHIGKGYMTDALETAISFVFSTLTLNRLEAACLTHNHASIRVLENVGFQLEGGARKYLKINGVWQDHFLFAALADDREA